MSTGSRVVIKYSVFCTTESEWVESGYLEEVPTTCPNNNTHSISTLTAVDEISTSDIVIHDDVSGTNGNWRVDSFSFDIGAGVGTVGTYQISYPYNVRIYNLVAMFNPSNVGDTIEVTAVDDIDLGAAAGNPALGVTTALVGTGVSVIPCDPLVVAKTQVGYQVKLKDGGTEESLGECISVDAGAGTITVENATTTSFSAGSKVLLTVVRFQEFLIVNEQNLVFGDGKIGGSLLKAGQVGTIKYTNKSLLQGKKFSGTYEIDY